MQVIDSSIESECGRLRVRSQGSGAPLVFLHGAHGMNTWPRYLDLLAGSRRVIAPDLPGFGQSSMSATTTRVHDLARIMLDLLDSLEPTEPVDLVGHCIGGWIGLEMAMRCARLRSLTLINSAGVHVSGVRRGDFFIASPAELPALLFADPLAGERYLQAESAGEFESATFQNRQMAARLAWSPRLFDPELAKWLCRIRVPTRVIWGEANQILPPPFGEAIAQRTGGTLHLIAGAGHLAHIERAHECALATLDQTAAEQTTDTAAALGVSRRI